MHQPLGSTCCVAMLSYVLHQLATAAWTATMLGCPFACSLGSKCLQARGSKNTFHPKPSMPTKRAHCCVGRDVLCRRAAGRGERAQDARRRHQRPRAGPCEQRGNAPGDRGHSRRGPSPTWRSSSTPPRRRWPRWPRRSTGGALLAVSGAGPHAAQVCMLSSHNCSAVAVSNWSITLSTVADHD